MVPHPTWGTAGEHINVVKVLEGSVICRLHPISHLQMQLALVLALSFVGLFSQGALTSPLEERQVPALCIFNLGTSTVRYIATYFVLYGV